MDRGGGIRSLCRIEDGSDTLVGLIFPGYIVEHEGPSIEGLDILRRLEPSLPQGYDGPPVEPNEPHDDKTDEVSDGHMCKKPILGDITDGQHRQNVAVLFFDVGEIVSDVYGYENGAGEDCDGEEEPTHHAYETEEDCSI